MRFIGLDIGRDFAHVAVVEGSGTARRLPRLAMGVDSRSFAETLGPDDPSPSRRRPIPGPWPTCSAAMRAASSCPTRCARRRSPRPSARPTTSMPPRSPSCRGRLPAAGLAARRGDPAAAPADVAPGGPGPRPDCRAQPGRGGALATPRAGPDDRRVRGPRTRLAGGAGAAADERLTLDAAVRIDAVLCEQITAAERAIATAVVDDPRVRRLLTIPGIGLVTAASILAVVGDIGASSGRPSRVVPGSRSAGPPVGRPAGAARPHQPGRPGARTRPPVRGRPLGRPLPGTARRVPRPAQGATGSRHRDRRPARKLAVLVWQLLAKDEDCRLRPRPGRPSSSGLDRLAGGRDAILATGSDWFQPRPGSGKAARRA